jgi:hypothetical protein
LSRAGPTRTAEVGSVYRSPPGPTFPIEAQITAPGATWIDRQLLAKDSSLSRGGFGAEVREAMGHRVDHLIEEGLARRQGQRVIFARDLIDTLRAAISKRPPPSSQRKRGSLIALPPRASMSRVSTASGSHSRPAASP